MLISVALDGARRRNLTLYPGDEATLAVAVYEHDGDVAPLAAADVTGARIVQCWQSGTAPPPVGTEFTVPSKNAVGRSAFRLVAEVRGTTTTLAHGVLTLPGLPCVAWCGCGWW